MDGPTWQMVSDEKLGIPLSNLLQRTSHWLTFPLSSLISQQVEIASFNFFHLTFVCCVALVVVALNAQYSCSFLIL